MSKLKLTAIEFKYKCVKTGADVAVSDKANYTLEGWSYDGNESHYSDSGVDLEIHKCPSCGKEHIFSGIDFFL